jgi:hypothetical protein
VEERDDNRWIRTFTGRKFWPFDPRPEDIDIRDIAHALSLICRFAGHCRYMYSVGQHSLEVSKHVDTEYRLWALLHDASEAYLLDVLSPIKHELMGVEYMHAETRLMGVICDRFDLDHNCPKSVKEADNRMLVTEQRDLMNSADWGEGRDRGIRPFKGILRPVTSPAIIERHFLEAFESYGGKRSAGGRLTLFSEGDPALGCDPRMGSGLSRRQRRKISSSLAVKKRPGRSAQGTALLDKID